MRFLVDHQLLPALASFLEGLGHEAQAVRNLGMNRTAEASIWNKAIAAGSVVISKDEGFYHLAMRPEDKGKLIWIRVSNCRREFLLIRLKAQLPQIVEALEAGTRVVVIEGGEVISNP